MGSIFKKGSLSKKSSNASIQDRVVDHPALDGDEAASVSGGSTAAKLGRRPSFSGSLRNLSNSFRSQGGSADGKEESDLKRSPSKIKNGFKKLVSKTRSASGTNSPKSKPPPSSSSSFAHTPTSTTASSTSIPLSSLSGNGNSVVTLDDKVESDQGDGKGVGSMSIHAPAFVNGSTDAVDSPASSTAKVNGTLTPEVQTNEPIHPSPTKNAPSTEGGAGAATIFVPPSQTLSELKNRAASNTGQSVWGLEDEEDSDDDDDEGYFTPDGLSEVGEEDEEEREADAPFHSKPTSAAFPPNSAASSPQSHSLVAPAVSAGAAAVVAHHSSSSSTPPTSVPPPSLKRILTSNSATTTNSNVEAFSKRPHLTPEQQQEILVEDLAMTHKVMSLFLNSHIDEAEAIVAEGDPHRQRLYYQAADAILKTLKGMMSFEPEDLKLALDTTKQTTLLFDSLRKHGSGILGGRLGGIVGKGHGPGTPSFIKSMTRIQLHAELCYAESLLMKAVLGIIVGGDFLALIKEALNLRAGEAVYRSLKNFLKELDSGKLGKDGIQVDNDFRSGVDLGTGLSALMLSFLPGKALKIASVFGYLGDRDVALSILAKAGGWTVDQDLPGISAAEEGVRRPVADLVLLAFHLVIPALIPVESVDVFFAKKILLWNLERYPNGVFPLFFRNRLYTTQGQPAEANEVLKKAIAAQDTYIQLQLICRWDEGGNDLALCDFAQAADCFRQLHEGSNWSKATYFYCEAAACAELVADGEGDAKDSRKKMEEDMDMVPKSIRKLVGKSIPIEKFVARKSRKYFAQGNRLALPGIELAYVINALSHTPASVALTKTIPRINCVLEKLKASEPETYEGGHGYWDDYLLAQFLKGTLLGWAALPAPEIIVEDLTEDLKFDTSKLAAEAEECLRDVISNGGKVELDHWIVFFAHYELGSIYERQEKYLEAIGLFNTVLSGKVPELAATKMTGKYSLHGALGMKATASLDVCKNKFKNQQK